MKRKIVFLHPVGPQGSPITSHTLFGAVCWAWAALGEDVGTLLAGWATEPLLAFSAAFPWMRHAKDQPLLLLLPRPPFRIPAAAVDALAGNSDIARIQKAVDLAKKLQQVSYLSQGVAEKLRIGQWKPADLLHEAWSGRVTSTHSVLLLAAEADTIWKKHGPKNGQPQRPELWKTTLVQRNSIDRVAGATAEGLLFQEEQTFYRPGCAGLWAAVWVTDTLWPKIEAAFRYLQDTGLGGGRALGKGHFRAEWADWDEHWPAQTGPASRFINLSEYIPAMPGEVRPLAYELRHIRQKAENRYPEGTQRVYMAQLRAFAPGGVFERGTAASELYGCLLALGDAGARTVYYSGVTIPLWGRWEV